MEKTSGRLHIPSILLMLASLLGVLGLFSGALAMAVQGLTILLGGDTDQSTPAFMMAGGLVFTALLVLPGAFYSLRRLIGHTESDQPPLAHGTIDWFALLVGWPLLIATGNFIISTPVALLFMPVISVIAAAIPVLFILRLAVNRLSIGARQRVWGILGLGLTASPLVILIAEFVVIIAILITAVIFLSISSIPVDDLVRFSEQIETMSEDAIIDTFARYLYEPGSLLALFGFVAVAVPLIEELFKTMPLWFFGKRLNSPPEGFLLGAVSGAAFALFENIGYAANDTAGWATTTLARFGAGSMHILTGGLMGWALASAIVHRKYLRLIFIYLLVVAIHGLWNAMGIWLGLGILSSMVDSAPAFWRTTPITALGTLLIMGAGALLVLVRANHRLRAEQNDIIESEAPPAM